MLARETARLSWLAGIARRWGAVYPCAIDNPRTTLKKKINAFQKTPFYFFWGRNQFQFQFQFQLQFIL